MVMSLRLANQAAGQPEIFRALQGEGPQQGRPSVFLRLAGCNLWCRWCDTAYTWRWSDAHLHEDGVVYDKGAEQSELALEQVLARVLALDCPSVVITGGEPLLQQEALVPLITRLRAKGIRAVDFETNGTVPPSPELVALTDLFVVSPKLSNAGVPRERRVPDSLKAFVGLPSVFKFVVQGSEDVQEVADLVTSLGIGEDRVWLMPEGRTTEGIQRARSWVASLCLEHGYRLSDRLHVHLSGDRRGT